MNSRFQLWPRRWSCEQYRHIPEVFNICRILHPEMNETDGQPCMSRYPGEDQLTPYALWIDGPSTLVAALFALIGAFHAVRFLGNAGLNKNLTAALFLLCMVDSLLMLTVVCFYSIEATGRCLFKRNPLGVYAAYMTHLLGFASSLTTSSTLLVIYITLQRFLVVVRPLRYASNVERRHRTKARKYSSFHESDAFTSTFTSSNITPPYRNLSLLHRRRLSLKKTMKPFHIPALIVLFSFLLNVPSYLEFDLVDCYDMELQINSTGAQPTQLREDLAGLKTVLNFLTQSVLPVTTILVLTVVTEYKVYSSLRMRQRLFESQQRSRSIVISEELKEKVSRYVAIFIAVKFVAFRTMPVIFDVLEAMYGLSVLDNLALSILIRVSDFMVVLNSATNSFVYFGKQRWVEKRLRLRLLRKEEKRAQKQGLLRNGEAAPPWNNNGTTVTTKSAEGRRTSSSPLSNRRLFPSSSIDSTGRPPRNDRSRLLDGDRVDM